MCHQGPELRQCPTRRKRSCGEPPCLGNRETTPKKQELRRRNYELSDKREKHIIISSTREKEGHETVPAVGMVFLVCGEIFVQLAHPKRNLGNQIWSTFCHFFLHQLIKS